MHQATPRYSTSRVATLTPLLLPPSCSAMSSRPSGLIRVGKPLLCIVCVPMILYTLNIYRTLSEQNLTREATFGLSAAPAAGRVEALLEYLDQREIRHHERHQHGEEQWW